LYKDFRERNNLNKSWIDYQKAFDTVPHIWIEKSTELIGVKNNIVTSCKRELEHTTSSRTKN